MDYDPVDICSYWVDVPQKCCLTMRLLSVAEWAQGMPWTGIGNLKSSKLNMADVWACSGLFYHSSACLLSPDPERFRAGCAISLDRHEMTTRSEVAVDDPAPWDTLSLSLNPSAGDG